MKPTKSEYVIFRFKVQPQTKALIESQWQRAGARNKSEWLRSLVVASTKENKSTVSELGGMNGAFVGTN